VRAPRTDGSFMVPVAGLVSATAWIQRRLDSGGRYDRRSLVAQLVLVGLAIALIGAGPWSPVGRTRFGLVVSIACDLIAALAAAGVARRLAPGDPARRFWWAMCVGAPLIGFGYVEMLADSLGLTAAVWPDAGKVMPSVFAAIQVGVLLTYRLPRRSRRERACFWLDMGTVLVAGVAFGWYFSPAASDPRSVDLLGILTGPAPMLVAGFAVAKLLIAGRPPFGLWPALIGASSGAVGALVAVVEAGLARHGLAAWTPALSALGDALLMVAVLVQRAQVDVDRHALSRFRRRPYSVLPYVALAAIFMLLTVAVAGSHPPGRTWTVLACVALSLTLVVARQLASFSDNARLLDELDRRVRDLDAALEQRDALAERLRAMAFRDSLTGLANRAMLHDQLAAELARLRRQAGAFGVLLLDLDGFKPVNDGFGHAVGDAVLAQVAKRLTAELREVDTVARLGGDEFAVLLRDVGPSGAELVADRLVASVRRPYLVGRDEVTIGVSVGISYVTSGESTPEVLLHRADQAMYEVKSRGKNGFAVWDDAHPAAAVA